MKIREISYGYTKNVGNYQSERLQYTAVLEDWEDPEKSLALLRDRVEEQLSLPDHYQELLSAVSSTKKTLEALERELQATSTELARAKMAWSNFCEFLVGHGVDPKTLTLENFAANRAKNQLASVTETEPRPGQPATGFYYEEYEDEDYEDEDY